MTRPLITALVAASLVLVAATPTQAAFGNGWRGWQRSQDRSSLTTFGGSGPVTIEDSGGFRGTVRARYRLPARWQRSSRLSSRTLRLETGNSCRHVVRFTPRIVMAPLEAATDRAAFLLPATGRYVLATGTRGGSAFRVIRVRGSATVRGVLVRPLTAKLPTGLPNLHLLYAEITAVAVADRRRACHAGAPRAIGSRVAATLAIAGAVDGSARSR